MDKPKFIARYWVDKKHYIAELSTCLALVTLNDKGEIIKMVALGERKEKP